MFCLLTFALVNKNITLHGKLLVCIFGVNILGAWAREFNTTYMYPVRSVNVGFTCLSTLHKPRWVLLSY